ncbi:hypothetical protein BDF19DRAFT_431417 [Syncephalis fuscata]|nr:hypothetical protein BDF19DRAFT_431417 [Syncephalis fuscata]
MISTKCNYSNTFIKDKKPIWTRNVQVLGTVPLSGSNRILVISVNKWTVHSIIDGVILAHIDVETLGSVLEPHSFLDMGIYSNRFSLYIGRFVIYKPKHYEKNIVIDLTNLCCTKDLGIANSEYLYEESYGHCGIVVGIRDLTRQPLLLNDTFNIRNATLIVNGKDYKIIDMSF